MEATPTPHSVTLHIPAHPRPLQLCKILQIGLVIYIVFLFPISEQIMMIGSILPVRLAKRGKKKNPMFPAWQMPIKERKQSNNCKHGRMNIPNLQNDSSI